MIAAQGLGISRAEADLRYIRRFVGATLAADTRTQLLDGGGSEPTLSAENGALQGRWPSDAAPVFSVANDALRATTRIRVARSAQQGGGGVFGVGFRGTIQAPTGCQANDAAITIGGNLVTSGGLLANVGALSLISREVITPTAWGSEWVVNVRTLGTATEQGVVGFRSDTAASEVRLLGAVTTQFRPNTGTSGRLRNPANTSSLVEWNATGLGFFGVAPIARPTITGSRGGNAALASLLTQLAALGLIVDSTT